MYVGVHTGVKVRVAPRCGQLGMGSGNGGQPGGLKPDGGQGSKSTLLLEISRRKEYISPLSFA